jgi:hypothetical protein
MKIPKYSCSACGKPSSRKWNLYRHISNCHAWIGKCLPNWDFPDTHKPYWNRWEKRGINHENLHHIRPDMLKHFFSSNQSNDSKPDYLNVFMEACLREVATRAVSSIQPIQSIISSPFSTYRNFNVDPEADHQIFGFRGYVCDKCLTAETQSVAFPNAEGEGRIEGRHFCHPVKAAAARELVELIDRSRVLRSLHDKLPILLLEKIDSRTGNNNHLIALRLSSPPEETIKMPNPANHSKPPIVFPYSKERHLSLEPVKENENKYNAL